MVMICDGEPISETTECCIEGNRFVIRMCLNRETGTIVSDHLTYEQAAKLQTLLREYSNLYLLRKTGEKA